MPLLLKPGLTHRALKVTLLNRTTMTWASYKRTFLGDSQVVLVVKNTLPMLET